MATGLCSTSSLSGHTTLPEACSSPLNIQTHSLLSLSFTLDPSATPPYIQTSGGKATNPTFHFIFHITEYGFRIICMKTCISKKNIVYLKDFSQISFVKQAC